MILMSQCFDDLKHSNSFFGKPFFFIYVIGVANERYY